MNRNVVEQYRLSLFGRLVMGVAHEVDNHLSVVLGFAELIQITGGGDAKTAESAGKIFAAGDRIASIVKHFSHHVRPHPPVDEVFSLAGLLPELVLFARYDLCRGNVSLLLPPDLAEVRLRGDARDFGLALLALLLNGAEAMYGAGGELSVGVQSRNGMWELSVKDQGPGIAAGIAPRIFEEGFTTKPGTPHTGMGLPVARHLVENFGGTLAVENRSSGGCASIIRFPGV